MIPTLGTCDGRTHTHRHTHFFGEKKEKKIGDKMIFFRKKNIRPKKTAPVLSDQNLSLKS